MPAMPTVVETTDAAASVATTYQITVGQSVRGSLATAGDHDWWAVDLVAGQTYTIAMVGTYATTRRVDDPFLRLRDQGGTLLASDDDSGPATNSQITFTATTTGRYYIDAGSYNNATAGQYGLSITAGTHASFDDLMGAGAIETPDIAWNTTAGTPVTVTYGFRQSAASYTAGGSDIATFTQCSAQEMATIRSILQLWSDVCGITFQEVSGANGYTDNATILIGNYNDPYDGAGAFAFYPGSTASTSAAGDVWLNLGGGVNPSSIPVGSYTFFAIMHELGHALGLSHPGDYNAAPGVSITYGNSAQFIQDSQQRTVMSYFDESATGANFGGYAQSPMLLDILAMQQIYGANAATRTGDTVYGFHSNAGSGSIYDASTNAHLAFCVWDAGGKDTFDFSGYSQNQVIDLTAGSFSNVGGLVSNVSVAYGVTIENALGGSGADRITGNNAANVIDGNAGNDTIYGGAGNDVINGGAGSDVIDGGAGNDMLTYAGSSAGVTVYLELTTAQATVGSGVDTITGIENLTGSAYKDRLSGTSGVNAINGGAGDDSLYGLGGNDVLNGGVGNDLIDGGDGIDTASYAGATSGVTVNLGYTWAQNTGGAGSDIILNIEYLVGSAHADSLTGNTGSNRIDGGSGNDTLTGCGGNDVFNFSTALDEATNVDVITDFHRSAGDNDRIRLDDAIFTALHDLTQASYVLDSSQFVCGAGAQATTTAQHIVYDTSTGWLLYDEDGSGSGAAIHFATLSSIVSLTSTSFLVY